MFMRRRRPLLGAAMVGGAGVMAGRHAAKSSSREADQEARIEQLEAQQSGQQQAPAAPAAAPSGGDDMVSKLNQLASLHQSGVLSDEEFAAAKQKLLGS